jgi:hypothetical protein
MLYALRYYWRLAQGYRLRPWRSPLVRWRLETLFGIHADELTCQQFSHLLWQNRRRVEAFLHWADEMERRQHAQRGREQEFESRWNAGG